LASQGDLDALSGRFNTEIKKFCNMFWDGYDMLCKIQLSFFSAEADYKNLEKAKKLARVGYDICHQL
jgi:hypothetical protein